MELINDYNNNDYINYLNIPINGVTYSVVNKYKNTHVKFSPIVDLILNLLNVEFGKVYPFGNQYLIPDLLGNFFGHDIDDLIWNKSKVFQIEKYLSEGLIGKVYGGKLYFDSSNNLHEHRNKYSELKQIDAAVKIQNISSNVIYNYLNNIEIYLKNINDNVILISDFFYSLETNVPNLKIIDLENINNEFEEIYTNMHNIISTNLNELYVKTNNVLLEKVLKFNIDFENIFDKDNIDIDRNNEVIIKSVPYFISKFNSEYTIDLYKNTFLNDPHYNDINSFNFVKEMYTKDPQNVLIFKIIIIKIWDLYLKLWSFSSTFYLFILNFINKKMYSLHYNIEWADVIIGWTCSQFSQLKLTHIFPKLYDAKYDKNNKVALLMENLHNTYNDIRKNDKIFFTKNVNNVNSYDISILGSILCQLIVGLSIAQTYVGFVHNDFHENNIMFKKTNKKNIYYIVHIIHNNIIIDTWYLKIPLYQGLILKIIDYGRSSAIIRDLDNRYKDLIFPIEYRNPESSLVFISKTISMRRNLQTRNNLFDNDQQDGSIYKNMLNTYSPDYQTTDLTFFFIYIFLNTNKINKVFQTKLQKQKLFNKSVVNESEIYGKTEFVKRINLNNQSDQKIEEIKQMLISLQKNVFLCNQNTPNFFYERDLYLKYLNYSTYSDHTIDSDCPNLNPINLFSYFQPYKITEQEYLKNYKNLNNVFYEADVNLNANYRKQPIHGNIYSNNNI